MIGGFLWTLLSFVVALGIIVTIHEYGHYIVGRWSGIRAEVFSIGFGPVIARRTDRRGTVWQIAALPLGGYVRFLGDADAASAGPARAVDPALARQTLEGAPLWARTATVAAGPVFNFALSVLVFGLMALWQGAATENVTVGRVLVMPPGVVNQLQPGDAVLAVDGRPVADWRALADLSADLPARDSHDWRVNRNGNVITVPGPGPFPPVVTGTAPRSPAAAAGLRPNDVITKLDGQPVQHFAAIGTAVTKAQGAPLTFTWWREGAGETSAEIAARRQDLPAADGGFTQRWLIGINGAPAPFTPGLRPVRPVEAARIGVGETWGIIATSLGGIRAMITGEISRCNLGGAISIAESTGQIAGQGLVPFLRWIGILSTAIGFLNLLPIPVLDGGHLAFYAWEAAAGRPPPERVRAFLTSIGLVLVVALMIFGLTNDLFCF